MSRQVGILKNLYLFKDSLFQEMNNSRACRTVVRENLRGGKAKNAPFPKKRSAQAVRLGALRLFNFDIGDTAQIYIVQGYLVPSPYQIPHKLIAIPFEEEALTVVFPVDDIHCNFLRRETGFYCRKSLLFVREYLC